MMIDGVAPFISKCTTLRANGIIAAAPVLLFGEDVADALRELEQCPA